MQYLFNALDKQHHATITFAGGCEIPLPTHDDMAFEIDQQALLFRGFHQ